MRTCVTNTPRIRSRHLMNDLYSSHRRQLNSVRSSGWRARKNPLVHGRFVPRLRRLEGIQHAEHLAQALNARLRALRSGVDPLESNPATRRAAEAWRVVDA